LILDTRYWIQRYRDTGYSYNEIVNRVETVSPRGFEILCANVFRANGHKVKVTEATNDGGKDIIVDNSIYVECKHYAEANFVGREICQKLVGSSISDGIKHGIVITTGTIHSNAFRYAEKINSTGDFYLELWDKKKLLEYIDSVENRKIPYVMNIIEA
jgi:HJR/Mrr/RecB family endonuclease